jgi:alpha-glucoside transport system substrate-binding protein
VVASVGGSTVRGAPIPPCRAQARRRRSLAGVLLATCALLGSCAPPPSDAQGPITLIGSWTGQELRAFHDVLEIFETRTGQRVEYVETRDLRGTIEQRLRDGAPLDLAGVSGPAHLAQLAGQGVLKPLADAVDVGAYKADVAPTFIQLGSVDGRLVGAFIKSTAKGLIWYNPTVFRLGTPTTWDDLQRMAAAAAGGDTHPWCVGLASRESSGWPGTDWIENILIRQSGPKTYDRWVRGELPWTAREVRRAFQMFGQIVAEDAVHGGSRGALDTDFSEAGQPLFEQPPGCLFLHQGSFMSAFLADGERVPGDDFDFFSFPELNPAYQATVVGAGDLVGLFSDRPAARALMAFLVSAEGQAAWVRTGAALSINSRVNDYPDRVSARAAALLVSAGQFRFDASDEMPTAVSEAFATAVLEFVADQRRLDEVLEALEEVRRAAHGG